MVYLIIFQWCRGVVVKHVDSQHRGCQFDSFVCHFQNTIGEEGNGRPSHEFYFPRKNSEPCFWFLLRSKSSMQHSLKIFRSRPAIRSTLTSSCARHVDANAERALDL